MMTERIRKLRQQSLDAVPASRPSGPCSSPASTPATPPAASSAPMQHAMAFRHLLENKRLWFGEGELIVGERGEAPPRPRPPIPR